MERIKEVKPLLEHRIWIRFDDGAEGEVDLSDLVGKGVFIAWNDPEHFQQVFVHPESRTVTWPGGIDLDPDVLYCDISGASLPGAGRAPSGKRAKAV